MLESTPTFIIGATGYVGAELTRLISAHPGLNLQGAISRAQAGEALAEQFPHLAPVVGATTFVTPDQALAELPTHKRVALFSAAPHTQSAAWIDRFIAAANPDTTLHCVDASADFRFDAVEPFEATYGSKHPAPHLLGEFCTGLPEHWRGPVRQHAGNPGCFATALLLATKPLVELQLTESSLFAAGITGSTGSGKSPTATTHHPERHNNLYSYKALDHRHVPEVEHLLSRGQQAAPRIRFVPHSGPFARGIHMTVQAALRTAQRSDELCTMFEEFYRHAPFVRVNAKPPRLKNVTGSNYANISVATDGDTVAVTVVIDNLIKGAAGGAIQWMNRLLDIDESTGLSAPATGLG